MRNLELARIFYQMADFLEMKEVPFKPRAFEKAARALESLEKDAADIYQRDGLAALKEIPGVGQGIAERIEEFIKTGKIKDYQRLKKECPVDAESLMAIEGLGSRKIKILYKKLKIKNLKDLEKAAKAGKIGKLEGFGQKSEENILQGIAFVRSSKGRFLLGSILPAVRQIIARLEKLPETSRVEAAGSVRRMKETIGDIDILATSSKPAKVMDFFVRMPALPDGSQDGTEVVKVWAKGPTKSSVRLKGGFDCDLRVIQRESFGAALQYFTGSKDHNILIRRLAIKKGLKLNEYGVFRGKKQIAGRNEKKVYRAIGLPYIEPELRTNSGEIEAAIRQAQGRPDGLPRIIGYQDIKGETHCHTDWSDGAETIEQMAQAAKRMGYQYMVIADHAGFLKIAHGLDEKRLLKQMIEIDKVNQRVSGIKILKGCEVDIKDDGSLAIKDEVLAKLDIVLGAVHSSFKMNQADMTKRLARAIANPHLDIIAHPTGRLIRKREAYRFDFSKIFKTAKENRTALEINAYSDRLDLKDADIRQAVQAGVKLTIGTDAHSSRHLPMMELGIAQARRGWATKKDILNSKSVREFLKSF